MKRVFALILAFALMTAAHAPAEDGERQHGCHEEFFDKEAVDLKTWQICYCPAHVDF